MPFLTPDITDERDGLAVFAQQQIRQVATTLQDLSPEQLAGRPTVSAFCLGDLSRHVIAVAGGIAGEIRGATAVAGGGAAVAEEAAEVLRGEGAEVLQPEDTAESLIAELEAAGAELAAAIRTGALEAPVPVPEAPWFSGEERWTVRWIALHAVEEVARHAGHADLLRESIDGQFAYALNARADGETWPPPGW
ncbi:DUF664 domain-containing protein [Brachybacterium sp. YJGR34]|uniref:mycothiol transferase n=1 Tax=Brachybacterium sp. YJGR34 TaxID=2059911 RepID=UPI000E0B2AB8|nr:DUF664 domain-containing protein [Brachybacterium sp. YJGR34]